MKKRTITISEEEAWHIYELLEELNDFLHQPERYREQLQVIKWLQGGVDERLRTLYYRTAAKWFEVDEATGRVFPPAGVARRFPE